MTANLDPHSDRIRLFPERNHSIQLSLRFPHWREILATGHDDTRTLPGTTQRANRGYRHACVAKWIGRADDHSLRCETVDRIDWQTHRDCRGLYWSAGCSGSDGCSVAASLAFALPLSSVFASALPFSSPFAFGASAFGASAFAGAEGAASSADPFPGAGSPGAESEGPLSAGSGSTSGTTGASSVVSGVSAPPTGRSESSGGRPGICGSRSSTFSRTSLAAEARNSRVLTMANPIADTKKIMPSQVVAFCRTSVVCAPSAESSVPPPNAAPRPSCLGR